MSTNERNQRNAAEQHAKGSLLPRPASVLRFTWERGLTSFGETWSSVSRALNIIEAGLGAGWSLRVALPFEVSQIGADSSDHADNGAVIFAARQLMQLGIGIDLAPRVAGNRALNTSTAATMHAHLLPALSAVIEQLSSSSSLPAPAPGVLLHLEPSPPQVSAAWAARRGASMAARLRGVSSTLAGMASAVWMARQGRRDLVEFAHDLRALPWPVLATSPPPLLPLDTIANSTALHWLLGCPDTSLWADDVDGALFGPTAALCFAPLLATVVGARDRSEQHRALTLWAARHREKSHAVCVGPLSALAGVDVDVDAVYLSPAHLRQDLQAMRALGFVDLTVTSLDGLVLDSSGAVRADLDTWLGAVVDTAVSDVSPAA